MRSAVALVAALVLVPCVCVLGCTYWLMDRRKSAPKPAPAPTQAPEVAPAPRGYAQVRHIRNADRLRRRGPSRC